MKAIYKIQFLVIKKGRDTVKEFIKLRCVDLDCTGKIYCLKDILIQTKYIYKVVNAGNREFDDSLKKVTRDSNERPVSKVELWSDGSCKEDTIYVIGTPYDIYKEIYPKF